MDKGKRKLFSLIYGDRVHIAPNVKCIPSSEFSTLLEAEGVLSAIQQDAARYRQEVVQECEQLKQRAAEEGFEAGFAQWLEEVARLEQQMKDLAEQYEKLLAPVAIKIAQRIVGAELKAREDAIVDIVSQSLKTVSQYKKIAIYVQRKNIKVLEEYRPRLKALFEDLQTLAIREDEGVGDGGCRIETEGGIINAPLENLWENLEQAFAGKLKNTLSRT